MTVLMSPEAKNEGIEIIKHMTTYEIVCLMGRIVGGEIVGKYYLVLASEKEPDYRSWVPKRDCGCFKGSAALEKGFDPSEWNNEYAQDEIRSYIDTRFEVRVSSDTPLEAFVMPIKYGDTPVNNPRSLDLLMLCVEYMNSEPLHTGGLVV